MKGRCGAPLKGKASPWDFLLLAVLLVGMLTSIPGQAADDSRTVKSLLEMRRDRVVVQEWDLSCGAAALATLLNYQHGDPVSEREIAKGLIGREEYLANPTLVRAGGPLQRKHR